jgi:hypothetical protein
MKYGSVPLLLAPLFAGCAGVVFEKAGAGGDVGFRYYPAKPYVVVEHGKDGDKITLVSLPDLSDEHRVRYEPGWGSVEFGFEVQNGMLVKFNSKTDAKGPETLAAVAGLGTAAAGLISAQAALLAAQAELDAGAELAAVDGADVPIVAVHTALRSLDLRVIQRIPTTASPSLGRIREALETSHSEIEKFRSVKYSKSDPSALVKSIAEARVGVAAEMPRLVTSLAQLEVIAKDPETFAAEWQLADDLAHGLGSVVSLLEAFVTVRAGPELYELITRGGALALRRVDILPRVDEVFTPR